MKKDENPYRILVIEDNLGDFVIIEDYLSEYLLNLQILHAEDYLTATRFLSEPDHGIDLVFLDLSLPDKSGEELVVNITSLGIGIPIVVLTGFSDLEFSVRSLALGASDYLVKDDLSPAVLYKSLIYNIQRLNFISELKESKRKYSDLFQLNPSPIMVYDQETLNIIDVNEAAILKYGFSREEFLSLNLIDIRPNNEDTILMNSSKDFEVNESKSYQKVTKHIKKNGEIMDIEIRPAKVKINNKDAGLVLVNDITEKLKYIRKIEDQNQTFKEIAWIQSHLVRAPLARLMGVVNLLENLDDGINSEIKELIDYIKISAEELDGIIRDISQKSEGISKNS